MNTEYRVSWTSWTKTGSGKKGKRRGQLRQTVVGAENLRLAMLHQSDEDKCDCYSDEWECGWCNGSYLPATDIKVERRAVGAWTRVGPAP